MHKSNFSDQMEVFSFFYGSSLSSEESANTLGLGFAFKPGITCSIATTQLDDETNPMISLGYISKHKEENSYSRVGISASYASSSLLKVWGFHGQISQLLHAQKNFPTSVDLSLSILNFSFNEQDNYLYEQPNQMVQVINFGVNQAFLAKGNVTPILGIGLNHEFNNSTTMFMISFGVNLNFDGKQL